MTIYEIKDIIDQYCTENPKSTIIFFVDDCDKLAGQIKGKSIDLAAGLAVIMRQEPKLSQACRMALDCYENVK